MARLCEQLCWQCSAKVVPVAQAADVSKLLAFSLRETTTSRFRGVVFILMHCRTSIHLERDMISSKVTLERIQTIEAIKKSPLLPEGFLNYFAWCVSAAPINPANNGCARSGRDLNSGWNWQAIK